MAKLRVQNIFMYSVSKVAAIQTLTLTVENSKLVHERENER